MLSERLMGNLVAVRKLYRDPTYALILAEDRIRGVPVFLQQLWNPGVAEGPGFRQQAEALRAVEWSLLGKEPELQFQGATAMLRRDWPAGRFLVSVAETQRDEVYLRWLDSALRILLAYHQAGLWPLAPHPHAWLLQSDAEGVAWPRLLDLALFPDLPLAARLYPEAVAALAAELWIGDVVDGRADLYALACLILRQRSPRAFERANSVSQYMDLHLGGRVADLVPKTPSPLNQLLRRWLQREPEQRPADAA